jgi:hypothetical protein
MAQWEPLPPYGRPGGQGRRPAGALILIALGLYLLLSQVFPLLGDVFLLLAGLILVALYLIGRGVFFLLVGAPLAGLGLGVLLNSLEVAQRTLGIDFAGAVIMAGLGLGCVVVWLLERRMRWILYPAGFFFFFAAIGIVAALLGIVPRSEFYWALLLIVLGAWFLLRRR